MKTTVRLLAFASIVGIAAPAHPGTVSIGVERSGLIDTVATGESIVQVADLDAGVFRIGKLVVVALSGCMQHCQVPGIFLDADLVNFSASGAGALRLYVTEQDVMSGEAPLNTSTSFQIASMTAGAVKEVTMDILIDPSNDLYAGGKLAGATFSAPGSVGPTLGQGDWSGSYSVTERFTITTNDAGEGRAIVTYNASVRVDEPSTLSLILLVAGSLVGWRLTAGPRTRVTAQSI